MIIVNFSDLVVLGIVLILIVIGIIAVIIENIANKFKKNCFECKYYKLSNVASFGGKCWYKCTKKNREDGHDMNDRTNFVKCEDFENNDGD